ncbi:universal stress protein [Bacillus wiedmannii]|uniref:universal stress protein n=1 Tax=Bacillus wiedmannii TaxID=1890302 RepID=UPI00272FB58C|nr:universal stress protein [Bacillus wiedmannii]MDP1459916.1 universal stress protein [Bacillus wiedmannii]
MNIVVPMDLSSHAQVALKEAIQLFTGANFIILIVVDIIDEPENVFDWQGNIYESKIHLIKEINVFIEKQKELFPNASIEFDVCSGEAKHEIIHYAKQHSEIDCVVMGVTSKKALSRVILGSTTDYVVQHINHNILVVREEI